MTKHYFKSNQKWTRLLLTFGLMIASKLFLSKNEPINHNTGEIKINGTSLNESRTFL